MKQASRMKELIGILNEASKAYYAEDREIMSNLTYDELYDELVKIEEETGIVLANSPTVNVGYESIENLPKEAHEKPMLSLGKTKDREELIAWVKDQKALLSWKLDGLTIVLTYEDGQLQKAVTRGNGEVGEVVTNNAKVFKNLPLKIAYQGQLIIRGEAIITYDDFLTINESIDDVEAKYKNPRNLCSGSVRQLNNEITANRHVRFFAFSLVKAEQSKTFTTRDEQMKYLISLGFDVVQYKIVDSSNILEAISYFEKQINEYSIPSDGLVLTFDNIDYGQMLGMTSKFPRDAIAFKWVDEKKETILKEILWSPSRTGLINPVAIFEPVELEGTTVSRASIHNLSIMKSLQLGIGDKITVYKANMIIPQIAENLTKSNHIDIPMYCPACGFATEIKQMNDVQSLYCINSLCKAKIIKSFTLFVSRDGMNIDGFSEASLEKFIEKGFIKEYSDIYHLNRYQEEIQQLEGFGAKSYHNLQQSIEQSRNTTLPKLIYSLGIANIGLSNAKMLCKQFDYDFYKMRQASIEELSKIDGIGEVIASAFFNYFQEEDNVKELEKLLLELTIKVELISEENQTLKGKVFVITGSLEQFNSRNELKEWIEGKGGKVTGSVTGKTDALINNDNLSNSTKNKKAKELNIPIITEQEFLSFSQHGENLL